MAVLNWLPNMRDPDVSARNAKLYEDAKQGQADYLAKLAGIKKTGAETRGAQIRNEGDALALSQQKALNGLFAKHFDPATQQLDAQGFSRDAMAAGILSPDAMQTPMKTTAGTLATGAAAAKSASEIQSYGGGDVSKLTAQPQAKKPSGAPAAPTTSAPQAPQAGFQAFANTLGGVAQEPTPYDPTKDVQEISGTFDKSLPAERQALASKQLSSMGAPNMQTALAAEAERFLGVMPKKTDYPGKQAEYKTALLERQARERGLKAHLQGFAGGIVPAGLATAAGIQAKEQGAKTFSDVQAEVNAAHQEGFTKVHAGNLGDFSTASKNLSRLENTKEEAQDLSSSKGLAAMPDDEFSAKFTGMANTLNQAEGVSTEAQADKLLAPFRASQSFGAIAASSHSLTGFATNAAKNAVSAQQRKELLSIFRSTLETVLKTGNAKASIDYYRAKKPSAAHRNADPLGIRK